MPAKSGTKAALKAPAEQVRQAERHEEGVAGGAGAERGGREDLPREAEHAADHGVAADGRDAA
jgi:hypothetical protein